MSLFLRPFLLNLTPEKADHFYQGFKLHHNANWRNKPITGPYVKPTAATPPTLPAPGKGEDANATAKGKGKGKKK